MEASHRVRKQLGYRKRLGRLAQGMSERQEPQHRGPELGKDKN